MFRVSGCARETIVRALNGDPILTEPAAKRLSDATGGEVTVAQLMKGGVRAKPTRKAVRRRKPARKGRKSTRARRKTTGGVALRREAA